jgi:hypothetical protein
VKKLLAAVAVMTAVTALSATPAQAAPAGTTMLLTVYSANDGSGSPSTKLDAWYLGCFPPTGTHPDYKKACKTLSKVDGWVEAIERDNRVCSKESKPVILRIEGTWKSRELYWAAHFENRCEAAAATRDVYPV